MKRLYIILLCVFTQLSLNTISAQGFSPEMGKVYSLCIRMRNSMRVGNIPGLKAASLDLKQCKRDYFKSIRPQNRTPKSLKGHFIFDTDFVDSLLMKRKAYDFALRYEDRDIIKRDANERVVLMRTFVVGKHSSEKFDMIVSNKQELAVIAEPEGLISTRIKNNRTKSFYNDTEDVYPGMPSRKHIFNFEDGEKTPVELEVINHGKQDISFVILLY